MIVYDNNNKGNTFYIYLIYLSLFYIYLRINLILKMLLFIKCYYYIYFIILFRRTLRLITTIILLITIVILENSIKFSNT